MTIKVFGDSHVGALRRGWKHLMDEGAAPPDVDVEFYASDGRYWLECSVVETDSNLQISQRRPGGETLKDYVVDKNIDQYFFSSPLHSAPLYRNRAWKACCPWMCVAHNEDLQALSSGAIEHWADRQARRRIDLLDKLCAGGISLAVVEPPKPLKRTPKMFGIRPDVLIAASNIYRNYVSALLDERGIPIIRTPEETYEDSGFTKSVYAPKDMKDYHHGNPLFGSLVMKEIVKFAVQANRGGAGQPVRQP